MVVDAVGEGHHLARRLSEQDGWVDEVPESGLGAAAASADLVLLESTAVGPEGFLAVSGSRAAAAVAQAAEVPVWLVAGQGTVLPGPMWDSLVERALGMVEAWEADEEVVPLALVDRVAGPDGLVSVADAASQTDCPVTPELFCTAV
jgi:translation initiation factor 2B subunit (eIF-2B alpha/beta/delta family)